MKRTCFVSFFILVLALPFLCAEESALDHYRRGLAYERLGKLQDAYTELQLASALDSKSSGAALALGIVAGRLGRYDEAQRALEQSIVLDANSVASYYHLAMICEKKNLRDRASEYWNRFLALNQDAPLGQIARKHLQRLESGAR